MSFNLKSTFTRLNTKPVKAQARMIAEKIETLTQRYGFSAVHIVGHSKGGLVARKYIQHFGGSKRTKSLITLGSPHHGTPTALAGLALLALSSNPRELLPRSTLVRSLNRDTFPAHIPLTSVYSKADVICPNRYSILRPRPGESSMENIEIRGVGHSQLTWDLSVYRVVQERLRRASELWADRQTRA